MRKIGHHPGTAETVEGWSFRRCRCGLVLGLSQSGHVWWVRANASVVELSSREILFAALATECRYHRPRAHAPATPTVEVGKKALQAGTRPGVTAGQSSASSIALQTRPRVVVKPHRSGMRTPGR